MSLSPFGVLIYDMVVQLSGVVRMLALFRQRQQCVVDPSLVSDASVSNV
ncbi:MAG: hypothetical protein U9Q68_06435 [Euryarchaeota archaeon]|nr:hypothetical protein [Euryarchaeota archaeon]